MPSETPKPSLKLETGKMAPPSSTNETPRPILKLNTHSRQASFSSDTPTPLGEKKTIKIKIAGSQPTTPAATPLSAPVKTKAGRSMKPTAKVIEAKKRSYDDSDDDRPMAASRSDSTRPSKMIKIKNNSARTPTTPYGSTPISTIKFKPRGEPVEHHPGDAYDSEASDKETDPTREQTFILRVLEGSSAEYLKKALAEGTIGIPKAQNGADFGIQFIDAKEKRAFVTVDGRYFAAVLVDLPTITEAMKTWDRKNMMKNSDISQMLLCFAEVRNEHEARSVPLPQMTGSGEPKWPHGITPPMHDAQNRRFRKAISEKQWQSTAATVKKLIEDDAAAEETIVEWLDNEADADGEYDEDEDAEGEADGYFPQQDSIVGDNMDVDAAGEDEDEDDDDDLLAEMEAAMAEEDDATMSEFAGGATPAAALEAPTPMAAETPAAGGEDAVSEEDEDEEEISDEDDDDDDEEVDEEKVSADRERREKMADLKNYKDQLEKAESDLLTQTNPLFKNRLKSRITNLKKEIAVKQAALGITEEEE